MCPSTYSLDPLCSNYALMFQESPQKVYVYVYTRLLKLYSLVYATFEPKTKYIRKYAWLQSFWSFPHRILNNWTLCLPYALRTPELDLPLPIWSAIYWSSWIHSGGEFGEQGNYSSLLPHLFMLESTSICPFGEESAPLPKIPFSL